jgi:hypothetical protein
MKASLFRLVFRFAIYNICRNRNALRHGDHQKTQEIKQIKWESKADFLVKGKFKTTKGNEVFCGLWGIKFKTEEMGFLCDLSCI